jgi:hypothetical protein
MMCTARPPQREQKNRPRLAAIRVASVAADQDRGLKISGER